METKIYLYAFGIWVLFAVLTIINGAIRNSWYAPKVGELKGHQISTIIGIAYVLIVTYLFVGMIETDVTKTDLLMIGVFWLIITIIFEFGFGHYIMGHPWSKLLADYNLLEGRLWSLFLLTTVISPLFWGYIKGV